MFLVGIATTVAAEFLGPSAIHVPPEHKLKQALPETIYASIAFAAGAILPLVLAVFLLAGLAVAELDKILWEGGANRIYELVGGASKEIL